MAQVQVPQPVMNVNAATGAATGGANPQFVPTSLYVGDLDLNVTDSQLYDLFNQVGQVVSVRVCRDLTTRRSLGYGYVNYGNPQDAARALEMLNFTPLNGKPIRVMYSHRDPSIRKSGSGNIFIKNLDKAIDHKALHETFSTFGNILSCKVATDVSGQSKGYGFVQYDSEEAAQKAIEKLNGMLLNDKQVYVGPFLRKQEREMAVDKTKFTNVFVKNLSESTTDEDLKKVFGEFGTLTSVVVMRDEDGKSKCFGFVNFENAEDAAKSVEAINGYKFDNKEWFVGKAQKKSEREQELKFRFEQSVKEAADKSQGLNLYIKNLDDSINDDKLRELFSPFGVITSCKVMRDPSGISRGSGFVAFSTPDEASRALSEMNGKMVVSKPLYVALAQRKEERRARLSSSRARSLTDPLLQPHQLVNPISNCQEVKLEGLETNHVVLVHGGGFGAWCWYKSIALLEEAGFKVTAIDLTGSGIHSFDTNSIASLSQYVKPLTDLLEKLVDGEKVILVGHDFGGACVSYAMELFPSKISKAVFIAAAMLTSGQSTLDMFSQETDSNDLMRRAQIFLYANGNGHPPTAIDLDKSLVRDLLFNQSPSKDVALASVSMRPIPFLPILEKLSLSDVKHGCVRRFYIETSEDNAIPISLQESMINKSPPERVFRLKGADHSPFFSKPQALHKILVEISKIP